MVAVGFDFEVTPARLVDGVGEICWGHETFVLESWRALNQMVLNQVEPLVLFPWQWNQNGVRGCSFGQAWSKKTVSDCQILFIKYQSKFDFKTFTYLPSTRALERPILSHAWFLLPPLTSCYWINKITNKLYSVQKGVSLGNNNYSLVWICLSWLNALHNSNFMLISATLFSRLTR